jgi:hypothetical protein
VQTTTSMSVSDTLFCRLSLGGWTFDRLSRHQTPKKRFVTLASVGRQTDIQGKAELHDLQGCPDAARNYPDLVCISSKGPKLYYPWPKLTMFCHTVRVGFVYIAYSLFRII